MDLTVLTSLSRYAHKLKVVFCKDKQVLYTGKPWPFLSTKGEIVVQYYDKDKGARVFVPVVHKNGTNFGIVNAQHGETEALKKSGYRAVNRHDFPVVEKKKKSESKTEGPDEIPDSVDAPSAQPANSDVPHNAAALFNANMARHRNALARGDQKTAQSALKAAETLQRKAGGTLVEQIDKATDDVALSIEERFSNLEGQLAQLLNVVGGLVTARES